MYPHHQYWCLYLVLGKLTVDLVSYSPLVAIMHVILCFQFIKSMDFAAHWGLLYQFHLKSQCACWETKVDLSHMKKIVAHVVGKGGQPLKWVVQHQSFLYLRLSDRILVAFEGEWCSGDITQICLFLFLFLRICSCTQYREVSCHPISMVEELNFLKKSSWLVGYWIW